MIVRSRIVALGLCVLGMVGAACSPGAGGSHPAASFNPSLLFTQPLTPIQAMHLNEAIQELTRRCMEAHGFKYYVPPITLSDFPSLTPRWFNFNYVDVDELRRVGFWSDPDITNPTPPPKTPTAEDLVIQKNTAYVESLSPAERQRYGEVLDGTKSVRITLPGNHVFEYQTGGCGTQAAKTLYGDDVKHIAVFTEAQDVLSAVNDAVSRSSEWKQGMSQWRACMRRHGYTYHDQEAILDDLDKRLHAPNRDSQALLAFEKTLARVHADCAEQAHLNDISNRQLLQAAHKISDRQARVVLEWNEMERHAAQLAEQYLSHG